ncbi:MAG: response regulator receiver domain [Methanomicrobium sp.]|nr:response regulator receiver domain [Methanomicrobium sp.]
MSESSFQKVAKEIILSSINSAICIDDQFPEPYASIDDEKIKPYWEKTKKLYSSFRENNCNLDIFQYDSQCWSSKKNFALNSRDLLILDWVLTDISNPNIPISIISESVIKQKTPYIIIYSDEPSDKITKLLFSYFSYSYNSEEEKISKFKDFKRELENELDKLSDHDINDIDQFFKDIVKENIHYFFGHVDQKEMQSDIFKLFNKKISNPKEAGEFYNFFKEKSKEIFGISELGFLNVLIPEYDTKFANFSGESFSIQRIEGEINSLYINNTLITVINKDVDANLIYDKLSLIAYKNPRNILSLLALEIKSYYINYSKEFGRDLYSIRDDVFYYHKNQVENEEDFKDFILQCFKEDFSSFGRENKPKIFDVINDYEITIPTQAPINELSKINCLYSTMNLKNRVNKGLIFGDILKINPKDSQGSRYLLCITPHCDCARPSKISNRFYFVEGLEEKNLSAALTKAETKCYSFIMINNEPKSIKWENKPFTLYIEEGSNEISPVEGYIPLNIDGKDIEALYVCTLKENFTQRISNNSFGRPLRVGITMAKLSTPETPSKK